MKIAALGSWVRVVASEGSDMIYNGRHGIVVEPTPQLLQASVRGQLAPNDFVAVHFWPRNNKERKHGSPMALLCPDSLKPSSKPASQPLTGRENE